MKRIFCVLSLVLAVGTNVRADLTKGSQTLALFGGVGGSSSEYDYQPGNQDTVTGGGGAIGGQYFYYLIDRPAIGLGVDFASSMNQNRDRDDLLSGYNTTARIKSNIGMVMARLVYPRGIFRPYLFSGLGVHHSTQKLYAQPRGSTIWPGGGTERRLLVDEDETSLALGYGIGLDIFPTEAFFLGLELRGVWLGGLNTEDNAALRSAGFTADTSDTVNQGNIFLRVGCKF